jgi:hypothetical protein
MPADACRRRFSWFVVEFIMPKVLRADAFKDVHECYAVVRLVKMSEFMTEVISQVALGFVKSPYRDRDDPVMVVALPPHVPDSVESPVLDFVFKVFRVEESRY